MIRLLESEVIIEIPQRRRKKKKLYETRPATTRHAVNHATGMGRQKRSWIQTSRQPKKGGEGGLRSARVSGKRTNRLRDGKERKLHKKKRCQTKRKQEGGGIIGLPCAI